MIMSAKDAKKLAEEHFIKPEIVQREIDFLADKVNQACLKGKLRLSYEYTVEKSEVLMGIIRDQFIHAGYYFHTWNDGSITYVVINWENPND